MLLRCTWICGFIQISHVLAVYAHNWSIQKAYLMTISFFSNSFFFLFFSNVFFSVTFVSLVQNNYTYSSSFKLQKLRKRKKILKSKEKKTLFISEYLKFFFVGTRLVKISSLNVALLENECFFLFIFSFYSFIAFLQKNG